MDLRVLGRGPPEPFLRARDVFETEYELSLPVEVHILDDPDERTLTVHYDDRHVLRMSRQAATSAMAREIAVHEYAHMYRYEQAHPSHVQSTEEALFLALAGRSIERRKLTHCYQIANHMKDIYADDVTLSVTPADKLVSFLEASLAAAVADRPPRRDHLAGSGTPAGPHAVRGGPTPERPSDPSRASATGDEPPDSGRRRRLTAATDPEITAVNAAFALALCDRNGLLEDDHTLYDLARVAGRDAPGVDLGSFRRRFRSLAPDPDESEYRKSLVDATREYAVDAVDAGRPAD